MAMTINPAVCRTSARQTRTILLHTLGAVFGAMLILTCIAFVFLGITAAMGSMMAWACSPSW